MNDFQKYLEELKTHEPFTDGVMTTVLKKLVETGIPVPQIIPSEDGGVSLAWWEDDNQISVDINHDYTAHWFTTKVTEDGWEAGDFTINPANPSLPENIQELLK